MRPFIDRYPRFLRGSPEFRDLQQALEPELLELWAARDSALEQLCVETAGWGLPYWEKTLGIPVDGEKDPEVRRSRIRVKLLGADVTTVELVRNAAEIWSGHPAEVTEYAGEFRFEIAFTGTNGVPPGLRELAEALRELLPAHLGWGLAFFSETSAALNVGALSELNSSLEVWPQIVAELESAGALDAAGVLEYHAGLEVWPQVVNELESGGSAAVSAVAEYHRTLELWPVEHNEEETA